MKKRIGNDITFTWHIYRKDGETQTPESFDGKDVEVKLISPLQRPVTIEDVTIATGVVTFTFKGKYQTTLGNYVAVLQENRGENGMVTLDVVDAVTLVPHSYMEEDGDDGDVIEASSVELESSISVGGGGGFVQQQADWAQTDDTAVDFIKNKPDLGLYVPKMDDDGHGNISLYSPGSIMMTRADEQGVINQTGSFWAGGWSVSSPDGKFQTFGNSIYRGAIGFDQDSVVWEKTATQQIPAATTEANGLMSAADKKKLDEMEDGSTAADVSYDNTRTGLSATNVQEAIDEMADTNLYETVVLTVGSADSSFNPVGQTITVTLEDGSATQYTVPMSRQITFIVQRGMRYTISGTSTEDYRVLPISVKAAIPIRYLTMRYIPIATGVFILQKDGNYYLREEYDAETMAEDAVGVLVLTSALINAGFGLVISLDTANKYYKGSAEPGTNNLTAFVGKSNTSTIQTKYPDELRFIVHSTSLSLEIEGYEPLQGYTPSYAEAAILYVNRTEINRCMATVGARELIDTGRWWTSTSMLVGGDSRGFKAANNTFINSQQGATELSVPTFQLPLS